MGKMVLVCFAHIVKEGDMELGKQHNLTWIEVGDCNNNLKRKEIRING